MKKRIIPVMAVAALVVALALWKAGVFRHAPEDRILISGNLELTEVDIAFKTPGKLVELAVEEGDTVKRGQFLARLDPDLLERQKAREEAGIDAASSGLAQLLTAIRFQQEAMSSEVELRRAELRQAEAHLAELEAGSRPQEVRQARELVAQARAGYEQAARDWQRAQTLYANEDISTAQYDQFRARFQASEAELKQAGERLALVEEGPRKETIEMARAQVARARAALRLAEATGYEVRRRQEELAARRAEIGRAKAQLAIVESQIGDLKAHSPIDGAVLVKSAELGEVIAAGTSVVRIGDLDRPWLRGYINQTDLGRVKLGQKARLSSDSFPGKTYAGRVSFIASEAEFTPKQIQTQEQRVKLVYRIKIDVENPRHELKSNMPLEAEILLDGR